MKIFQCFIMLLFFINISACSSESLSPEIISAAMTQTASASVSSENNAAEQILTADAQTAEKAQAEYKPTAEAMIQEAVQQTLKVLRASDIPTTNAIIQTAVAQTVVAAHAAAKPTTEAMIQTAVNQTLSVSSITTISTQPSSSNNLPPQSTESTIIDPTHDQKIGYSLDVISLEDPITNVDLRKQIDPAKVGNKNVAVKISISNNSGEQVLKTSFSLSFLIDSDGYVYEDKMIFGDMALNNVDLSKGEKSLGWVGFEIPSSSTPIRIK